MASSPPPPVGHPTDRLIGTAPGIVALRAQIRHLATFDSPGNPAVPTLLLQGETGTGKGLVARVVHDSGPRVQGPFVEVNCAAIPETMLEAELFGFEPGAFTDAKRAKPGLFEAASGGTLFLDEIDALPPALQGKLLTAIEAKRTRRLGAVAERGVDVKLIAATNVVLPEAVTAGRFRADLYHRLAVVVLSLPPLRARGEDVWVLAEALMRHYTDTHGVPQKRLDTTAQAWLREYTWPGNVRELSHVMERVTLLHPGEVVDAETLTQLSPLAVTAQPGGNTLLPVEPVAEGALAPEALEIRQALAQTGGNVAQAARLLGVSRDTVRYRMQRYGIERPRLGASPPSVSPSLPGVGTGGVVPVTAGLPLEWPVVRTPSRTDEPRDPDEYAATDARSRRLPGNEHGGRFRSPFVGRERELTVLDAALERVAGGRGQVVSLVGAPGLGKSRLLHEFRRRLSGQPVRYAAGQCVSEGTVTPYLPIIDLLRGHCEIAESDGPEALAAKVCLALEHNGTVPEAGLPLLLDLLGVPGAIDRSVGSSAEMRRARMFEALWQAFIGGSRQHLAVLTVDNLHWIDPSSEAFLAQMIERMADVPLLVVTTAHPGYRPPWGDKPYVTHLAIRPLDLEAGRQLVHSGIAPLTLPPALEQQLLARADGNPFFLEELAHMLDEHGDYPLAPALPDTVQAVLALRLDHLAAPEKRLLEVAAVCGHDVAVLLLRDILALPEATLGRRLEHLQAADFLVSLGGAPALTYVFKHVLTQEVVYQSLPTGTRRQYHHQIARALSQHIPLLSETRPELLAHHYTAAGSTEQAIACWQQAGRLTAERAAYLESMAHFSTALALLQDLPDTPERQQRELALRMALESSSMAARGLT